MIDQLREKGRMKEAAGSGSFGRALVSVLRRVAILVTAVVGVLAVFGVLLWGCVTAVERSWNPPERRDAEVRCPWFERAEVRTGGYGSPDWCVRIDSEGREFGEWIHAEPYD
jgi:hypothetical protein